MSTVPWWTWLLILSAGLAALVVVAVLTARRRTSLQELLGLVSLCFALLRDILRDPAVPRRAKIAPALVLAYLALPIDLIPTSSPWSATWTMLSSSPKPSDISSPRLGATASPLIGAATLPPSNAS